MYLEMNDRTVDFKNAPTSQSCHGCTCGLPEHVDSEVLGKLEELERRQQIASMQLSDILNTLERLVIDLDVYRLG